MLFLLLSSLCLYYGVELNNFTAFGEIYAEVFNLFNKSVVTYLNHVIICELFNE